MKGDSYQTRIDLRKFFVAYKGRLIFHGGNFDIKILINELFMSDELDYQSMLWGLHTFFKKVDDTKLIAYLATNTTAGNKLGLKHLAHEFAGNWAKEDIIDITKIPLPELLEYNLVDCLSTWYVYDKYKPIMIKDKQAHVYDEVFIPALKVITQMELVGMPIDIVKVMALRNKLKNDINKRQSDLKNNSIIIEFNNTLRFQAMLLANKKLKVKVKPLSDFDSVYFNPNSNQQLAQLLFQHLKYKVIDTTDTGQPSTGAEILKKLLRVANNDTEREVLNNIIDLAEMSIILNTFIAAFIDKSIRKTKKIEILGLVQGLEEYGYHLHGSFNLGGTVSGRLSSSNPNLTNIPSTGTVYAKPIKECFRAPNGWLMTGADFDSLEDKVSALTTKDKNKLRVYLNGYDGHSLRAASYFIDEMPDIKEELNIQKNDRVFKIKQNNTTIYKKGNDIIKDDTGNDTTVEAYFDSNK